MKKLFRRLVGVRNSHRARFAVGGEFDNGVRSRDRD